MTVFVDAYHTPIGAVYDMRKTVRLLEETTVREPLQGTNLGVRAENDITPVFITGCRDSERDIPLFTHPISVKNSNGKSYLFTDMRFFIRAGAELHSLDKYIRRNEEFEFTKYRGIASLAWAGGDRGRFEMGMRFGGLVYSAFIAQTIGRTESLAPMDQLTVQVIALAYYMSLFREGAVHYAEDEGMRMAVAQYASKNIGMPVQQVSELLKTFKPMGALRDMCEQITISIQSALLKELNVRVLLNLISNGWYASNSADILKVSMEHPPTWCSILYFCMAYNNFKRTTIGQTIQAQGRGGKADDFHTAYKSLLAEYTAPQGQLRSVFEYLEPGTFATDLLEPQEAQ